MEDATLVEQAPGTHYGILVGDRPRLEVVYDMDLLRWAVFDPEGVEVLSWHAHRWQALGQAFEWLVMGH